MSYYLCFKKNGVNICNFCRITSLYQALSDNAPWDEWETVNHKMLQEGIEFAQKEIEELNKEIDKLNMILPGLTTYEDRSATVENIIEYQHKKKEWEAVITQIEMLILICGERDENNKELHMEWGIF